MPERVRGTDDEISTVDSVEGNGSNGKETKHELLIWWNDLRYRGFKHRASGMPKDMACRYLSSYAVRRYNDPEAKFTAEWAIDFCYNETVKDASFYAEECCPERQLLRASDLQNMQLPELKWIVPGLLPEGLSFLVGKPKVFKSFLALDIALAVASGGTALGGQCEQGPVLYLALEDNSGRLQRRCNTLMRNQQWPKDLFFCTKWATLDEMGELPGLREHAEEHGFRLIIIDTFAKIRNPASQKSSSSQYQDDYKSIIWLQEMAGQLGISVLIVHHQRKSSADDILDTVSGSTGITGAADNLLILDKPRHAFDGRLQIVGRDMLEDLDLAVKLDPDTCGWKIVGPAEEVLRSRDQIQILEYLKQSADELSPKEIASELQMRPDSTRRNLRILVDSGLVRQDKRRGKYYT